MKDGLGNNVDSTTSFDLTVTYQQGVYHLPVFDVEYLINGLVTRNIRPLSPTGNIQNKLYYDDSNIPFSPLNNSPQSAINGCDAPCHTWVNPDYGNENTINTWFFADESTTLRDESPHCLITAINDTIFSEIGAAINIPVLSNDLGSILDPSSVAITVPPNQGGTVQANSDGTISYLPENGFMGIDSFQYLVCYDLLPKNSLCDLATVYVSVSDNTESNCQDGFDNDNDGLIDCEDPDCQSTVPNRIQRKGK